MISVALIADSGPALEAMTRSLAALPGVDIVRHCHGHARIGAGLKRCAPDLVLLDEMHWPRLALQRLDEIREAAARRRASSSGPHGPTPAGSPTPCAPARARSSRPPPGPRRSALVLQEVVSEPARRPHPTRVAA